MIDMLGYIYLTVALLLGYAICETVFPGLKDITHKTYRGQDINLSSLFIRFPAWFVVGTIMITWTAYIGACVFSGFSDKPLIYGDILAFLIAGIIIAVGIYHVVSHRSYRELPGEFLGIKPEEWLLAAAVLALSVLLMYRTLNCDGTDLYIGLSVFSDFTPHVSMVRSFSYMQNFPTQYTVCAGADIKYHFMFTFLVGNLEFLGMRIDHAFNIPSIMGLFGSFMVLYALAVKLTGKRPAGMIACLMFAFRSSGGLLYYLAALPKGTVWETLKNASDFVGVTPHEDWGLWNLNVYCNQRHLAFALILLLLIITVYLEPLFEAAARITKRLNGKATNETNETNVEYAVSADQEVSDTFFGLTFFSKEGWMPVDLKGAVCTGIILGALGFWNGAVLIATVIVLFFLAIFADRRLEYLIIAAIAGALSLIQTKVFIDGSALGMKYQYGFLAENPTVFGSIDYLIKLLGLLPFILIAAFAFSGAAERYVLFAFSTPVIFAFCVSMTPDIAVNHKYIMISVMLLNIFAAGLVCKLFDGKEKVRCVIAVFLILCMTSTGIYDLVVVLRRDRQENSIVTELDNEVTNWIRDNCLSKDLFLTSNIYLAGRSDNSRIIMSGASLYDAWQYFGWSAGYDTPFRDSVVAATYSAGNEDYLRSMINEFGFDYIIIDRAVRENQEFDVNESLFDRTLPVVFSAHEGEDLLKIYKCSGLQ
ncbi:MAG: hypothetical protein K6G81_06450 [Lachnospiraceae bacterium]|nr:hypothetical protein [Lachnospiraceae bacterium]